MTYGEIGCCDYDDFFACYCQCATAINRLENGWGSSIEEVIYQDGQYETWWYEYLMETEWPDETTINAVDSCIADWAAQVPSSLIYADSRDSVPEGFYIFYESPSELGTYQRFYAK